MASDTELSKLIKKVGEKRLDKIGQVIVDYLRDRSAQTGVNLKSTYSVDDGVLSIHCPGLEDEGRYQEFQAAIEEISTELRTIR